MPWQHPDAGCDHRAQARSGGHSLAGQAADARVRPRRPLLRPAVATGTQPVASRALHRRIEQRLGCRAGRRPRPRVAGLGYRRLDPRSRLAVRARRPDAQFRDGEPGRRDAELVHPRSLRTDGAHRGRLRDPAAGDRRPRSTRCRQRGHRGPGLPRHPGRRRQGAARRRTAALLGRGHAGPPRPRARDGRGHRRVQTSGRHRRTLPHAAASGVARHQARHRGLRTPFHPLRRLQVAPGRFRPRLPGTRAAFVRVPGI